MSHFLPPELQRQDKSTFNYVKYLRLVEELNDFYEREKFFNASSYIDLINDCIHPVNNRGINHA